MWELETLLSKRWILKSKEKELYYKVRDALPEIRKITSDKLGCSIIENALLVKLEKVPVIAEPFMGIQEFTSKEEYAYLCVLLMFLEDMEAQAQFILSQLTEYITANMPEGYADWTLFTHRRRLVKVLRYAVRQGMLLVTDGSDDVFMNDVTGEILYENTGASRYFMRSFSHDIMSYQSPQDFAESDWFDMDEERGIARRHRVYRRLLFAPAMYSGVGVQEDFEYLKYYGRRLEEDLERIFDCRVHIHRNSAYLVVGEDCDIGEEFPGNNVLSDIMLLTFGEIRKRIKEGTLQILQDETCVMDRMEFERLLLEVREQYGSGFTKNYREITDGEYIQILMEQMQLWMFAEDRPEEHQVILYPAVGKITGRYPNEFLGGNAHEQQMAGK